MAQVTDRNIGANPTGFAMRTEINNIIAALESDNSGSSEPLNTVAYMKWVDTSNATYYYVKERNHDNTAWVTLFRYTVATKIMEAVSNGAILDDSLLVHKTGYETIAGVKTFASSPLLPVPTLANQAISMGNIIEKTSAGIGYGTGSGGTVTQLTSKSTEVTLNKPCGQITMNSASLAAGASVSFTLLNNTISANDTIKACIYWEHGYYSAEFYSIKVSPRAGNVAIIVTNTTASARAEAVIINFAIIKGAIA